MGEIECLVVFGLIVPMAVLLTACVITLVVVLLTRVRK